MIIKIKSADEIIKLGQQLATSLQAGDVVLLDGELGAGKTTLTKGIALELGITKNVKSPTFTLVREYLDGRIPLFHMDMYRLEYSDPFEVGVDEYLNGAGVTVIEWSEFITELLPEEYLRITIEKTGDNSRSVTLDAIGTHYLKLIEVVKPNE